MRKAVILGAVLLAVFANMGADATPAGPSAVLPARLRVESLDGPVGVATGHPSFSWSLTARDRGARGLAQTAYGLLVASSARSLARDRGDVWDSGEVRSSRYYQIEYAGSPLHSHTTYYWKARVTDQSRRESPWSKPASFTTALLSPSEWKARWIAAEPDRPVPPSTDDVSNLKDEAGPLPLFRHEFHLDRGIKQALVYVSGLGQYELRMNGENVTDTVLNPGWTDYRKTVLYNTYDVTSLLRPGANAIGVMLGNGMYNVEGVKGRYTKFIGSFGQPKLVLQLHVAFVDGSETDIVSDGSWKTSPGPITFSSTYGGEDYDARREQRGWDSPAFDDAAWKPVLPVHGPGGVLSGKLIPPMRVAEKFAPVKVSEPAPGVLVYDLGQNFSGWPRISVRGPAGATVKLIAGELLDPHGRVTQRSANASPDFANIFSYTLSGRGEETWHPRFSYYGFRYVQVEGASRTSSDGGRPRITSLAGEFVHDAVPENGSFSTSTELFDRIHRLIDFAILSNMASVLTDCPHREKLGWLEQTHLAATSIMLNYGVLGLYRKMADDMEDSQLPDGLVPAIAPEYVKFVDRNGVSTNFRDTPEWGSASILSPWAAYQFYGDTRLLADHYEVMTRYAAYLRSKSNGHILSYGLGDWYDIGPKPPGESQLTGKSVTATAIYYQDLTVLTQIAKLLNKPEDSHKYAAEAEQVKTAFNAALFHPAGNFYDRSSQTADAMPLVLGLVPEPHRKAVLDNLVVTIRGNRNHVTAGDIGFHYVVRALTDGGRSDVLYDMLSRTDSPSYGFQLKNGATSLTEAWDTNRNSSQNHFMLGHAEEWFYRGLAGIDFDLSRAAPRQIVIRPAMVGNIADASASYDSVLGPIISEWHRTSSGRTMHVRIPPGATATVYLPANDVEKIRESGHALSGASAISHARSFGGSVECVVGSGDYRFEVAD